MTLYSLHNARPAPLPFRITLPNSWTRTDPATFTDEEITAAGFTGPFTEPPYDPATEQLDWVDGAYVVSPLPPQPPPIPQPRWVEFSSVLITNLEVNAMLSTVLQTAPGLYGGLVVGLQQAAQGDDRVFINSWKATCELGLCSDSLIGVVQTAAAENNLPEGFIEALHP